MKIIVLTKADEEKLAEASAQMKDAIIIIDDYLSKFFSEDIKIQKSDTKKEKRKKFLDWLEDSINWLEDSIRVEEVQGK